MKALIQYCEPKYEKTDILYEFYNSISNIAYLAVASLIYEFSYKYDSWFLLILVSISIGSFCLHAFGTFTTELLDEIPMVILLDYVYFKLGDNLKSKIIMNISTCIMLYFYIKLQKYYIFLVFFDLQVVIVVRKIYHLSLKNRLVRGNLKMFLTCFIPATICWFSEQHLCPFFPNFAYLHSLWHILSAFSLIFIHAIIVIIEKKI